MVRTMRHSFQSQSNNSSLVSEHSVRRLPNSLPRDLAPKALETNASGGPRVCEGSTGNRTQLFSGWKEIANYMHSSVRTVQRWEKIGLPVRRVTKSRRAPVIAFAEDLDGWARSWHVPLLDRIEELQAKIYSLEDEIRSLKHQLRVRNRSVPMDEVHTSDAIRQRSQDRVSRSLPRSGSNNSSAPAVNDYFESAA